MQEENMKKMNTKNTARNDEIVKCSANKIMETIKKLKVGDKVMVELNIAETKDWVAMQLTLLRYSKV